MSEKEKLKTHIKILSNRLKKLITVEKYKDPIGLGILVTDNTWTVFDCLTDFNIKFGVMAK